MKAKLALIALSFYLLALPAFAASGAREDNSNLFVWVFLGMCALILALQLLPVIMVLLGLAKGVTKSAELEAAEEPPEQ